MVGAVSDRSEADAWYRPDKNGIDEDGYGDVLTKDEMSPCRTFAGNSCLVQIQLSPGRQIGW